MHPRFCVRHEAIEEQRRGDRARIAVVGIVVEIGDAAFQGRFVAAPQRHAPDRILRLPGMAFDLGCKRLVVGEEGRQFHAGRHACRAGQRGDIDQEFRRLAIGFGERIGEDETALRISVADLHGQALAAPENIARPVGVARDGILHRRDQDAQPHVELRTHHHVGNGENRGRAAHVFLHRQHAGRGLEIVAAGIETDAFADQRDLGCIRAAPDQIDQTRRALRALTHRMDKRIIGLQQRIAHDHREFRAMLPCKRARRFCQLFRPHVVGRRVDQVARQEHSIGNARDLRAVDAVGQNEFRALSASPCDSA